jgi:hypothetical protein
MSGALDGQTPTSSFGAASFWLTNNQGALPRPGKTTRYQKTPVPYGTLSTTQIGGSDTDPVQVDALVKATDYAGLAALGGTVATLTLLGDVARTALLAKVASPRFYAQDFVIVGLLFEFS